MPGGKMRLKALLTGGLQVGKSGDFGNQILSGSVSVSVPGFGAGVSASTETVEATIANLGASDLIMFMPDIDMATCVLLLGARAGAGQASLVFQYNGASDGGASADAKSVDMRYIAFSRG